MQEYGKLYVFILHMYSSKLEIDNLIIVGAHLTKKKKKIKRKILDAMIDLINFL